MPDVESGISLFARPLRTPLGQGGCGQGNCGRINSRIGLTVAPAATPGSVGGSSANCQLPTPTGRSESELVMPGHALPLFFGPEERPLFGWYHQGSRARREGLVICSPFGQEDLGAHRTIRFLACAAAEQGTPTLRFDYDGCGDSAGDDLDPDRLARWLGSVDSAIDELRRRARVDSVCLLGVRIGALLASLAAAKRDDVSSLIAISPVVSGRAFVREWTALGLLREWKTASAGGDAETPDRPANNASTEAAGYVMTKATRDELARIDLMQTPPGAAEILIIDRDDLPRRERWAKHLAANGAQVKHEVLPGYLGMVSEPHKCQVPQAIVSRVLAWLSREGQQRSLAPMAELVSDRCAPAKVSPSVRETPLQLDDGGLQFGIVTEPWSGAAPGNTRRALLLINAGACRHIGSNRTYVPLARHFAAQGWTVLRVDISGIGDSDPHDGEPENAPYTSLALRDIATWLAFLRQRGMTECHLLGVCSGAYHGFKAAVAGLGLTSVLSVNPLVFFWHDGMPLDPPSPFSEHRVLRRMVDQARWRKLLSGEMRLAHVLRILARRSFGRIKNMLRGAARTIGIRLPDDVVTELREVQRHGVKLHFVFADDDPGFRILQEQGGAAVRRMQRNGVLSIRILDETDHTFSTRSARRALQSEVEAQLGTRDAAIRDNRVDLSALETQAESEQYP
jgi:pimeloyl-ACP methyl ester carboxylesterase